MFIALLGARKFASQRRAQCSQRSRIPENGFPAVSVLKPLHGMEPQLEANLESFFQQDYPIFELIFAVDHPDDAALPVARSLCAKYPDVAATVLITGEPPWPNPPAYSFSQMAEVAKYDVLVTSDSDVVVASDYLRAVAAPLIEPNVGMVTCLYRGLNTGGFWSLMDAIGMSVEMTAGVVIANMLEGIKFGLGPTIVVTRDALDAIGGYASLGDYFSNDFVIGNLIAAAGFTVVLSEHVIDHVVPPMSFRRMWQRQLRWATGTKHSRPKGHFGSGLVYSIPYGLAGALGFLLIQQPVAAASLIGWALLNRMIESVAIGYGIVGDPICLRRPWLFAVRDLLGFCVWVMSYLSRNMRWRSGRFELVAGGKILVRQRDQSASALLNERG